MEKDETTETLVLDERVRLTMGELCRTCGVSAEYVVTLVEEGLIEPEPTDAGVWRFHGPALLRVRQTLRLQRDLELNVPGAVLAVELLEEVQHLRARVRLLEELLEE
ncbi:MAG TPA: chaperone modulator CbpM [Gammaproteobacteria bacterium]|nr:chaperone modulator CbpM [Gammaproteobacteria bacterium]